MKKLLIVLGCVFFCLFAIGCVKQKNCEECSMSGTFQYLKEPIDGYNNNKITAIFYVDGDTLNIAPIVGYIPQKHRSDKLIKARVCLQEKGDLRLAIHLPNYKLKCIEKED